MSKNMARDIIERIKPHIIAPSNQNNPLSPELRFLICLRFLAGGTFQTICGDVVNVSQPTVSRCISSVLDGILTLRHEIHFPNNLIHIKDKFHDIAGFPGVIGAVDGTHIRISKPTNNEAELFRCRKGFYSLNVQVICGHNHLIYDVVARWPGSTHDSRIFRNSSASTIRR